MIDKICAGENIKGFLYCRPSILRSPPEGLIHRVLNGVGAQLSPRCIQRVFVDVHQTFRHVVSIYQGSMDISHNWWWLEANRLNFRLPITVSLGT